jgi:hypothetical protein
MLFFQDRGLTIYRTICYACITPSMNHAQIGFNIIGEYRTKISTRTLIWKWIDVINLTVVIAGLGQTGPLMVLPALVQFTSPHAFLSTATGLAFSARALGGAFGSAILNTIINGELSRSYAAKVSAAAASAGLPASSIPELLGAFASGRGFEAIRGIDVNILQEAIAASRHVYARAYRLAWSSIIPFVVLAWIAVAFLKGVKELMTEHVEATVEKIEETEEAKV